MRSACDPRRLCSAKSCPQRAAGVDNSGGFDRVTVKHGTIDNYLYGVRFIGSERLVARDLTEGETTPLSICFVCLEQSTDGVVRSIIGFTDLDRGSARTLLDNAGSGIGVGGSQNTIRHSTGTISISGDQNTVERAGFKPSKRS